MIPGVSLHQELQRFVDAGLTPLQALQTATINPARFLNETADFGAVEKDKTADLLLLDANPLESIANTRKIAGVILAGKYLSPKKLENERAWLFFENAGLVCCSRLSTPPNK